MKKNGGSYLKMKTDAAGDLITSDMNELGLTVKKLANHVLTGGLGLGTFILKWVAFASAVYLLVLDRTNWRSNMLTSLLIPYIFFSLPALLFNFFRGEIGKWVAFVAVILRLFFPQHYPDWLELPGALILLIVVAPNLLAVSVKDGWIGLVVCLAIGIYLLQEHIRASGGFKNAFTKANGVSNTIGIVVLLVYPVWALIIYIL